MLRYVGTFEIWTSTERTVSVQSKFVFCINDDGETHTNIDVHIFANAWVLEFVFASHIQFTHAIDFMISLLSILLPNWSLYAIQFSYIYFFFYSIATPCRLYDLSFIYLRFVDTVAGAYLFAFKCVFTHKERDKKKEERMNPFYKGFWWRCSVCLGVANSFFLWLGL